MDEQEIWRVIERGGMAAPPTSTLTDEGAPSPERPLERYNGLSDPAGAEALGRLLAERARPFAPNVILLRDDAQDAVLAHVLGRELGVPGVRAYDNEGLLDLADSLPAGSQVLVFADAFRDTGLVRGMRNLVERERCAVVATAVLAETDALDALPSGNPLVSLVSVRRGRTSLEVPSGSRTR